MKWNKVEDRLPEREKEVFVLTVNREVRVCSFCDWSTCDNWHLMGTQCHCPQQIPQALVTHWAEIELPEPT